MEKEKTFKDLLDGYRLFRQKYTGDNSIMKNLSAQGQNPQFMLVSCCDSRVDPALILQCDPGDLFVVRNIANIVPPYEKDEALHGTSAALEFGVRVLKVKNLILLGHSQCGGIQALLNSSEANQHDFVTNWVSLIKTQDFRSKNPDTIAKLALNQSHQNCLTFPWINDNVKQQQLTIHLWFFDIKT